MLNAVLNPEGITTLGLASSRFARRYFGNLFWFLFLRLLRCFSSAGLPTYDYFIHHRLTEYCSAVFPHSDIRGSMLICSSPQLFAAYHVLHRLLVPRHPPCALSCLTFPVLIAFKTGGSLAVSFHRVYNVMSSYCFDSLSLKDNSSDVSFSYL